MVHSTKPNNGKSFPKSKIEYKLYPYLKPFSTDDDNKHTTTTCVYTPFFPKTTLIHLIPSISQYTNPRF